MKPRLLFRLDCPDSPNHGITLELCRYPGFNPTQDEPSDEHAECRLLDGKRAGQVGFCEIRFLKPLSE
ncbi:hypothetical protein ACODYM_11085 [Burkholderia gladioli]|uniref:hypothetical protein n=1 Tax=Burkholderia gladioli TaxID=28095 RepID=UPI003B50FD9C